MPRASAIAAVQSAIGARRLLWVGTRGTDAQPLLQIEQFAGVIGLIAPLGVLSWDKAAEAYLEEISRVRVDLNTYSIDDDTSPHARELHRRLRDALRPGTIVATYRPTAFLAAAYYPRMEHATYLERFHGLQAAFEHKPWVETELAARGVPTIPWRYFSDDDPGVMAEWMEGRACVLRANYSDGGAGLALVRPGQDARALLPEHRDGFFAVAPLLDPSVPLNASGCVFRDGRVTVRHPSIQLIGVAACTNRPFGYCGNDFAAVESVLGRTGVDQVETIARDAGRWLHEQGYVGAFGIDALAWGEGQVCLTEINPRFQGSSAAAAALARDAGMGDVYLDHLCALLGQPAAEEPSLWEQAREQARAPRRLSQVICYNTGPSRRARADAIVPDVDYGDVKGVAGAGIVIQPDAMLFKLFVRNAVTRTGFDVPAWLSDDVARLADNLYEPAPDEPHDPRR